MNFDLTEEQEIVRSSVERFTARVDVEARRKLRAQAGGYDRARWRELAELGLVAAAAREEAGGLGASPVDLVLVGEAIGRSNVPDPWLENGVLPARLLDAAGAHAVLGPVLTGDSFVAFAWAERAQRYSFDAAQTTVEPGGHGASVLGQKTFVLGAAMADAFIITAQENGRNVMFLVPRSADGLELRPYRLADGSVAGELSLSRVALGDEHRLVIDPGEFDRIVADIRLLAAAELVGLGQRLLDDTLAYVKERKQFDVPIGSFQALQHRLVDCYCQVEQSRSMLYRTALADRADRLAWKRATASAKAFISESVDHVAREAVQMHGGMGITDELAIGHALKRVQVLSRLFGDVHTMFDEFAAAV